MRKLFLALAGMMMILTMTGCASPAGLDIIMGRTTLPVSVPTTEPKQDIDCDLIFP